MTTSFGITALKRLAIVLLRAPWELPAGELAKIGDVPPRTVAQAAIAELANGTDFQFDLPISESDIVRRELRGVLAFAEAMLVEDLKGLDREHAWAVVLGQHRARLTELQGRMNTLDRRNGELQAELELDHSFAEAARLLLHRCLPILETSDASSAARLFHEVRRLLGDRA